MGKRDNQDKREKKDKINKNDNMNEEEQLLLQFLFFIGLYAIVDNNIQHLYRKSFPEFLALILVAWKN